MSTNPKTRVGLLTDLHYDGGAPAMNRLYEAVATLNVGGASALVVMGDLVDADSEARARRLLREVSALCDAFKGQTYFMPGNHDLDHLTKERFFNILGRAGDPARFHFEHGGHAFVCLDCNFSPDGTEYADGNFDWREAYVPDEELDWLRARLAAALVPAIVISHQRIDKETKFAVRNHAAVREMIALSDKVKAVFQGHTHTDDMARIDGTAFYALSAHVDDAGPALIELDARGVRLLRDFEPGERTPA